MKRSQATLPIVVCPILAMAGLLLCSQAVLAHVNGAQHVHFQKPRKAVPNQQLTFRATSQASVQRQASSDRREREAISQRGRAENARSVDSKQFARENSLRDRPSPVQVQHSPEKDERAQKGRTAGKNRQVRPARQVEVDVSTVPATNPSRSQDPFPTEHIARKLKQRRQLQRDKQVTPVSHGQVVYDSGLSEACAYCGSAGACEPGCGMVEAGCGIGEPGCGIAEPGCGIAEPGCGIIEPGCGIVEPGCGIVEPGCGIVDECGSCVGPPKPDYWCFPVCLPRLRVIEFQVGVHSFRDARDFVTNSGGTANYGFQEGINVGSRLPLIGRLFPQISYQLGYQATQSRLSGTTASDDSRSQSFVTIGMYRRVPVGLQFGVVWDFMDDQLSEDASKDRADLQQIRFEISLKTPRGREFGFLAASHLNSRELSFGGGSTDTYQSVDQYMFFYRWHFFHGGIGRCWIGGTDDSEVVLGADFQVPLNDRWSLQSGFNYLSPDQSDVTQESWNLGINMIWHWGRMARTCERGPYRPLFPVADNGWMFVDRVR